MWEQIRANRRKSVFLILMMAMLLVSLGYTVGEALAPGAGPVGLLAALGLWAVLVLVSYFEGSRILMGVSGARHLEKEDHPRLFNVVEEMCIASGLKKMPEVYVLDSMALNAFAAGRNPDHAAVAVTAGLLGKLNRDQLQGVIAHEISHIVNRDILFMTMLSIMVGAIVIIAEIFLRGLRFGGRPVRSRSSSRGAGGGAAIIILVAIVLAILAPLLARLIYFAASRRREYLADANGAVLTRYPEGLASALEALAADSSPPMHQANRATAPLFIVNPLETRRLSAAGLFSTHPPLYDRIRILRTMGNTVSFKAYQQALDATSRDRAGQMPASVMGLAAQPARTASPEVREAVPAVRQSMREAYDTVRKAHQFRFLECPCGLRVKVPPTYTHSAVRCPRCHRALPLPTL